MTDLVSCLCITRDRPDRLRTSVEMFLNQTYPRKELVIVIDPRGKHGDWLPEFELWLDDHPDVRLYLPLTTDVNIAKLRNYTITHAEGDIIATWDDDDYYHPDRLRVQADRLLSLCHQGYTAVCLENCGVYFEDTKEYHLVYYDLFGLAPSMMSWKTKDIRYKETEVRPGAGERSSDAHLQQWLHEANRLAVVGGQPWLYTRVYHGGNVWERAAFERMVSGQSWYPQWAEREREKIRHGLRLYFPDPVPKEAIIRGGQRIPLYT